MVYAQPDDLQARWRTLTPEEQDQARTLLGDAERRINAATRKATNRRLDDLVADGTVDREDVIIVAVSMVRRAMSAPDLEGVTQASLTTGPFTQSHSFASATRDLYLTAADLAVLGFTPRRRAFSVDLGP